MKDDVIGTAVEMQISPKPLKLFTKNYLLLWQGQLISKLGNQIYIIALILWLKEVTGSKTIVSLFGAATSFPLVVIAIFGGAFADRFSRKKIIIGTDFLNGINMIIAAALFFFMPQTSMLLIILIFILAAVTSASQGFFGPAISAAIPDIVPEKRLAGANTMGKISDKASLFFGSSAAGFLYTAFGLPIIMLFNGLTFLVSAFSESFVKIPQIIPKKSDSAKKYIESFKTDLIEGLTYIKQNKGLNRLIMLSVVTSLFATALAQLIVFYVTEYLSLADEWFGIFMVLGGIGSLVGSILAGIFRIKGQTRMYYLIAFMLLQAIGYILLVEISSTTAAVMLFIAGGIMMGFTLVHIATIMQLIIPSEIRGRVLGSLTTLSGSFVPLGMALGGFLADIYGLVAVYRYSGILMFISVLIFSYNKDLRKLLAYQPAEIIDNNESEAFKIAQIEEKDSSKIIESQNTELKHEKKKPMSKVKGGKSPKKNKPQKKKKQKSKNSK